MTVVQPDYKSPIPLIILSVIIGVLLMLGFGDFSRKQAEAARMESDTHWQDTLRSVELPLIQAQREAEAQAAIAKIEADKQAEVARIQEVTRVERERNNQRLAEEAAWVKVKTALFYGSGLALIAVVACALFIVAWRLIPHVARKEPWDDSSYKAWRIALARWQEWEYRGKAMSASPPTKERKTRSNGHTPQPQLAALPKV